MKKKVAHIFNLISMALRDSDFDEQEKKAIIEIAKKAGVSYKDIQTTFEDSKIKIEVPLSLSERIQHLHDLVTVMLADGIIHEEEMKYIGLFTKVYGFLDVYEGAPIEIDTTLIKNQLPYQKFLEEYRLATAETLSPVVVDNDFNIKFPLYNTALTSIGPLPKTLYVFFLLIDYPISISDLSSEKNKKILQNIYAMMPNSDFAVEEKIENLTNPDGLSFNSNRSIIKRALMNVLPKDNPKIINNYKIGGGRNQRKSISLSKDLVKIQPQIH